MCIIVPISLLLIGMPLAAQNVVVAGGFEAPAVLNARSLLKPHIISGPYHHILDPNTGRSANGAWSVTILGPEATLTDALSTSVFVLGPERGMQLVDSLPGIDAIIIDPEGQLMFSADLSELQP